MNPSEFQEQYFGSFKLDERQIELENRVSAYFDLSDSDASNSVVIQAKKELLEWVKFSGYSRVEYLAARRHCASGSRRFQR